MAALKNDRHEHFAQLVAGGKSLPQAYVSAGYSERGAQQSSNRLLRDAVVRARVEELRAAVEQPSRERAIEKAAVDKAWVLQQLIEVAAEARKRNRWGEPVNLGAANRALELIGKELAMFVDRSEVRTGPLDGLEHDQIAQLHDAILALRAADPTVAASAHGAVH